MKQVLDAVRGLKVLKLSDNKRIRVKTFLNANFSEVEWDVVYDDNGGMTLVPTFKNEQERSFYILKWS